MRHSSIAILCAACSVSLTTACSPDAESTNDPFEETRTITLSTPDVRVGSLDGPDALVPVGALVLAVDGSIRAGQGQDGTVLAVGADGSRRFVAGGLGEGPGEFASISGLGWVGDTLWVSDNRSRRVTLLDDAGEMLGTLPYPTVTPAGASDADPDTEPSRSVTFIGLVEGGSIHQAGPTGNAMIEPDAPISGDDPVLFAPRAGGSGTMVAMRSGTRDQVVFARIEGGQIVSISVFGQPMSDRSLIALGASGDGLAVVDRRVVPGDVAPQYTVTRILPAGDTLWSTRRPYTPVASDPSRQDSIVEAWADQPDARDQLRARLFFPESLPPARSVFIGRDGRTWVARERPDPMSPSVWDVFAADGRLAAEVTAPGGIELKAADRSVVWGIETDAVDVPYLVRFRLPD